MTDTPDLEIDPMDDAPASPDPVVEWQPTGRRSGISLTGAAGAALALGALAVGALAIGALAIGTLAIGRLAVGRGRFRTLEIDNLVIRRLQPPA